MGYSKNVMRYWLFRCLLALLLLGLISSLAWAQSSQAIVRVEEDWELVIGEPDPDSVAPQVTCVISPTGHLNGLYAALELNQQSLPDFAPGGLQLQVWNGEQPLSARGFPSPSVLFEAGETVRWTQSLELVGDGLQVEIINGSSTTWGSFGGQGYLKATVSTPLTDLNAYDPAVSAADSVVSYAGNRVQSLVLKRVRVITAAGDEFEDTNPRVVYPQQ